MIREAGLADVPDLVEFGRRFAERATPHVGFDAQSVADLITGLINSPDGIVLRSDRGMIGVVIYPHPFNNNHRVAQELFWWSEDRQGLWLLKEAENALEGRCDSIVMITLETIEPDRMAALYNKMGFAPMERGFVKEF